MCIRIYIRGSSARFARAGRLIELYYGIILQNHITDLYYGIMRRPVLRVGFEIRFVSRGANAKQYESETIRTRRLEIRKRSEIESEAK